jgi:FO synthase subunit 2
MQRSLPPHRFRNYFGLLTSYAQKQSGYRMDISEILEKVREAVSTGATEICIQGGLLPDMRLDGYCEILESIKSEFPDIHLHSYSPMEV